MPFGLKADLKVLEALGGFGDWIAVRAEEEAGSDGEDDARDGPKDGRQPGQSSPWPGREHSLKTRAKFWAARGICLIWYTGVVTGMFVVPEPYFLGLRSNRCEQYLVDRAVGSHAAFVGGNELCSNG